MLKERLPKDTEAGGSSQSYRQAPSLPSWLRGEARRAKSGRRVLHAHTRYRHRWRAARSSCRGDDADCRCHYCSNLFVMSTPTFETRVGLRLLRGKMSRVRLGRTYRYCHITHTHTHTHTPTHTDRYVGSHGGLRETDVTTAVSLRATSQRLYNETLSHKYSVYRTNAALFKYLTSLEMFLQAV